MRLLAAEQPKRENSAVVELLKMNFWTVTMKAGEQIGTLMTSLERSQKAVDAS